MTHPETFLQMSIARWLENNHILYCASAGGMRTTMVQAINMKRMGYKKGFPDLLIFEAHGGYHGMAIEVKQGTYPTAEQKEWQESLTKNGYYAIIVPAKLKTYADAMDWVLNEVIAYTSGVITKP